MSGLEMKYFVLKPKGSDPYAEASRKAMSTYARAITKDNKILAEDLRKWAKYEGRCALAAVKEDSWKIALLKMSEKPLPPSSGIFRGWHGV